MRQDNALVLASVQLPFEEAAHPVYPVCPNTIRKAIEGLGQMVVEGEQSAVEAAWGLAYPQLLSLPAQAPERGTVVWTWEEMKRAAPPPSQRSDSQEDPEAFGRALWLEGYRQEVSQGKEVVAIGDGANWIWNLVKEHFPGVIRKAVGLESSSGCLGRGEP